MKLCFPALLICCVLTASPVLGEELTVEKKKTIRELLEVTGATEMGEVFGNLMADETIKALQQADPDVDPRAFDIIREESRQLFHEEFAVKKSLYPYMYPIYHKHLTLAEVRGLIQFYRTPLGQKAISVMPKMSREGALAGQKWAATITPVLKKRIRDRFDEAGIAVNK